MEIRSAFFLALLLGLAGCGQPPAQTTSGNPPPELPSANGELGSPTREDIQGYWFNGAELNRYALTQSRYGAQHEGEAVLIFVSEPFLLEEQVKHERGDGESVDVLKVNFMREFPTGLYEYNTMLSVFSPIAARAEAALKVTFSSQDWCGQVWEQFNHRNDQWLVELRSYFQSEGDQNLTLPGDTYLEDALWTQIRLDPAGLPEGNFPCVPSTLALRFEHKQTKAFAAVGEITTEGDTSYYRLNYPRFGRTLTVEFDTAFPHTIRAWTEAQAGKPKTTATLTNQLRETPYWNMNQPGDEQMRETLGLRN